MQEIDLNAVLIAGVPVIFILTYLVTAIREALKVPGRYLPLLAAPLGVAMMGVAVYAPESVQVTLGVGLGVAAASSTMIRFANGKRE